MLDDPPTSFGNERLDPDTSTLFEDSVHDQIHWKDENENHQRAHAEAAGRILPAPSTSSSQDGNKPVAQFGSIGSSLSGASCRDDQPLDDDEGTLEVDADEKESERAKREGILQMSTNEENMRARLVAMGEQVHDFVWRTETGDDLERAAEEILRCERGEEGGSDGMPTGSGDFYSDDEKDHRERQSESNLPNGVNEDRSGADGASLHFHPSTQHKKHDRQTTRTSVLTLDKPLPAVPDEEYAHRLTSVQVLLRLLPIKIGLIQQTNARTLDKKRIYAMCERIADVCEFAEEAKASCELQGRCAFYTGVAEYLRGRIDENLHESIALVIAYFENAQRLCDGECEEGAWAEEWVRMLERERDGPTAREDEEDEVEERTGPEEGLITQMWRKLGWSGKQVSSESEAGEPTPIALASGKSASSRKSSTKARSAEFGASRDMATAVAGPTWFSSGSSSFGGRFAAGKGQKLLGAEDGVRPNDDEEQVPNNGLGGLVPIADLPQAPPQKRRPVNLGLDTDGKPLEPKNTILSPSEGLKETPERYAHGFGRSPTTPTIDKIVDAGVHSPDSDTSPCTAVPPSKGKGGYRIVNPDVTFANASTDSQGGDLSKIAPQATSVPSSSSYMRSLTRRLSSAIAISPTSGTSVRSPMLRTSSGKNGEDGNETNSQDSRRLSLAERRRQSSVAYLTGMWRKSSIKPQDSVREAEEGNSPHKPEFDIDGGSGKVGTSPLSPPGSAGDADGLRRRKSGGRTNEDLV